MSHFSVPAVLQRDPNRTMIRPETPARLSLVLRGKKKNTNVDANGFPPTFQHRGDCTMRETLQRSLPALVMAAILAVALNLAAAGPAHAANIYVQSTADSGGSCPGATCTLRQAVAQATPFDAVRFSLPVGSTITLLTPINVTTQVTVFGPGAGNLTLTANHTAPGTSGGELFAVLAGGDIGITDLTLQGNSMPGSLPLVYVTGPGNLTIVRCTFRNAYAGEARGGGIKVSGGYLTIEDSTFTNNRAGWGGAVYVSYGQATILRSTFSNNYAYVGGGAVEVQDSSSLTVTDSTFTGNSVGDANNFGYGGAIDLTFLGGISGTIAGSTFVGNSSTDFGGAVNNGGSLAITNSTFTQNSATVGGAIASEYGTDYTPGPAVTTLKHVTIAGNSATNGGGLYVEPKAAMNVQNSILSKNPLTAGGYEEAYGAVTTQQYNLVQYPGRSTGWDPNFDRKNTDPLLFALGDYGGPTRTMPANVGGFVIDEIPPTNGCNGANVTVDQRGILRPQSTGCDRGAFERVPGATSTVTFNSNGGSAVPSLSVPFNTTTTAPAPPIRTGWTFVGWYSDVGLTSAFLFSTPITANITLNAKWSVTAVPPVLQGAASRKAHGAAGTFNLPL